MASARKRRKQRRRVRTLGDCLRQFLTPAVWKQGQKAIGRPWGAFRTLCLARHFVKRDLGFWRRGASLEDLGRVGNGMPYQSEG